MDKMAHTLLSHTTIFSRRTISFQNKQKQKMFSSLTISYPSHLICVTDLIRAEKEQEIKKKNKRNKD